MTQPSPLLAVDLKHVSLLWATQDHAAEIGRLHATLFETAWDEVAVGRVLANPGSIAMIAAAGTPRLIGGFALAQVAADEAEILTLGVAAPWQRRGIGGRLLEGVKRAAKRAGAGKLYLEVAQSNAPALALYGRAGLRETGRRKGYYARANGAAEDALLLSVGL